MTQKRVILGMTAALLAACAGPAIAGSESSGSEPPDPYIPAEPFRYECDLVIERFTARGRWASHGRVVVDNAKTVYHAQEVAWQHSVPRPPYELEQAVTLRFTPPDAAGMIATMLILTFPVNGVWPLSHTYGRFGDPTIGGMARLGSEASVDQFAAACRRSL